MSRPGREFLLRRKRFTQQGALATSAAVHLSSFRAFKAHLVLWSSTRHGYYVQSSTLHAKAVPVSEQAVGMGCCVLRFTFPLRAMPCLHICTCRQEVPDNQALERRVAIHFGSRYNSHAIARSNAAAQHIAEPMTKLKRYHGIEAAAPQSSEWYETNLVLPASESCCLRDDTLLLL